jgi:hypothetical protein
MKELYKLLYAQCKLEKQNDKLKEINNERKNLKRKLQRSSFCQLKEKATCLLWMRGLFEIPLLQN